MRPQTTYQQHLKNHLLKPDAMQAEVVAALDRVYDELLKPARHWFSKRRVKGVYIWGEVGRGKTYLMDLFYNGLPFKNKLRVHFHRFMRDTHDRLFQLKGHANPLKIYAKEIARQARVLCFDECVVNDITDAMILGNMLTALFKEGVCVIMTSNIEPSRLYWHGLQRERFLPAIKLIEEYTQVMNLDNQVDYRLQHLMNEGVYFYPLDDAAKEHMQKAFLHFSQTPRAKNKILLIEHREIRALFASKNAVYFDFKTLCDVPRSQRDYLALAEQYDTILVSEVPQLKADDNNLTRNFISLIDVLYDEHKICVISAQVPLDSLYLEGRLSAEFKRTLSRLQEMQSLDYLTAHQKAI